MSKVMSAEDALKKGNSLFVDDNFSEALEYYNLALELEENNVESLIKRSTCYYKLDKFTDSLTDANAALKLEPNNAKALLRKGLALFSLEEYEAAKLAFEKGQEHDSQNTQFRTWIRKCLAELETEGTTTTPVTPVPVTPAPTPVAQSTTPAPSVTPAQPVEPKLRHEWYQTNTHVVVSVFIKNAKKDDTKIDLQNKSLSFTTKVSDSKDAVLEIDLYDSIIPAESTSNFLSTKVEIKLKKANANRWNTLEGTGEQPKQFSATSIPTTIQPPPIKKAAKNWDKIVTEAAKTEPLDNDGDPLNKVFQDIFSNGSDEQKRAMMKSFVESGGTVLSTNWDEVGKGTVKGSPPAGMEMHKWSEMNQ